MKEDTGIELIPGRKLCTSCRLLIQNKLRDAEQNDREIVVEAINDESFEEDAECEETIVADERERLNRTLNEMDISPLKLHSLPHHSRHIEGKRKLTQVKDKLENSVAIALSIDQEILHEKRPDLTADLNQKANDLDILMDLIKDKMSVSNREKKVQLLTRVPMSWTYEKVVHWG